MLVKKENATLLLNFCHFLKEMCKIYNTGIWNFLLNTRLLKERDCNLVVRASNSFLAQEILCKNHIKQLLDKIHNTGKNGTRTSSGPFFPPKFQIISSYSSFLSVIHYFFFSPVENLQQKRSDNIDISKYPCSQSNLRTAERGFEFHDTICFQPNR